MTQIQLSFIIPAYNEENFIDATLRKLDSVFQKCNLPYEIIVVDDGSQDKTLTNALKYAKNNGHVRVLSYPKNMGKGYAVKTGFLNAAGNIVFFTDSDLEIDLCTLSKYLEVLKTADIVIASKSHPGSVVSVPFFRKVLSYSFNILVRLLTGLSLRDTQCGLKAMRKDAFVNIFPRLAVKRYAFDVELLVAAHVFGLKIVELPVKINSNAPFEIKNMFKMFIDLLGVAYRLRIHPQQQSGKKYDNKCVSVA
jgi:dolichol-phosphate mannosyltransferase